MLRLRVILTTTLLLFATAGQCDDLELTLDKNLADKFLSEVSYPYTHTITPKAFALDDEQISMDEGDFALDPYQSTDYGLAEFDGALTSELENQIVDELMAPTPSSYAIGSGTNTEKLFEDLKSRMQNELKSGDREKVRSKTAEILATDATAAKQFQELLKSIIKVDVRWIKVQITQKPNSLISNPIEMQNLKVGIKADLRACVKIGKWFCTGYFTVGYIRLEGRKLALELISAPPKLLGRPKFDDLDIVIKFTVLGKTFKIKIGITTIVNKQLDPVTVVDLSEFEVDILNSGKKLIVDAIVAQKVANGLLLKVNLKAVQKP